MKLIQNHSGLLTGGGHGAGIDIEAEAVAPVAPRPADLHQALQSLVRTVNEHDTYTGGHSCRVATMSGDIARLLGFPKDEIAFMQQAGLVHDIGKIGIPDGVLNKIGPLNADERYLIRLHPILGASILSRMPGLDRLVPVVLNHHECWDGSGYPSGRSGVRVPIESRIILVVDAFDAMTSIRPYGHVRGTEEALAELRRHAGTQFDPMLVDAMHEAFRNGLLDEPKRSRSVYLDNARAS
ncbi:MAG TPA: HD-GYP domain-containing protein [Actinomycetota bacterium]|nr:HD-GYP domain-containing protein [Actinomycetota bacterium]